MKLILGEYFFAYTKAKKLSLDMKLTSSQRLTDILTKLGIPIDEVYITVINSTQVSLNAAIVSNSDIVMIFPPIMGG